MLNKGIIQFSQSVKSLSQLSDQSVGPSVSQFTSIQSVSSNSQVSSQSSDQSVSSFQFSQFVQSVLGAKNQKTNQTRAPKVKSGGPSDTDRITKYHSIRSISQFDQSGQFTSVQFNRSDSQLTVQSSRSVSHSVSQSVSSLQSVSSTSRVSSGSSIQSSRLSLEPNSSTS